MSLDFDDLGQGLNTGLFKHFAANILRIGMRKPIKAAFSHNLHSFPADFAVSSRHTGLRDQVYCARSGSELCNHGDPWFLDSLDLSCPYNGWRSIQ